MDYMEFNYLSSDFWVFIRRDGGLSIILVYVEDLIFISNSLENLDENISRFLSNVERTEELLSWYLGFYIVQNNGIVSLPQCAYTD